MLETHPPGTETLGTSLARQRLEHRARRLEAARAALRRRAVDHEREGYRLPPSLSLALEDFSLAIDDVRREMDRLGHRGQRFARPIAEPGT